MKKEQRAIHLVAIEESCFTFLWIQYKKKKYKRKEVLEVLIHLS